MRVGASRDATPTGEDSPAVPTAGKLRFRVPRNQ
jgi:hypothetical protein